VTANLLKRGQTTKVNSRGALKKSTESGVYSKGVESLWKS
jgi:hypothetical protein